MTAGADAATRRPSVLVVDDDRTLRSIIATNLGLAGFDVRAAGDRAATLAALDDAVPDVIVLDLLVPPDDGLATLDRIRHHATAAHVPVIALCGPGDDDPARSLDAGADDFIAKPFAPHEMLARVRAKVRRAAVDASLQPLTRLPGNIAIEHELVRRFAAPGPWAIVYADLDNFKAYNDVYGFQRGDDALRYVAATLVATVRELGTESDFVGHIGGDDFLVVTTADRAEMLAAAIVERFDHGVAALYDEADRQRGWIATADRRGAIARFPLMSISLAVVARSPRVTTVRGIGEVAAEVKKYAKSHAGSYVATERRR